MDAKQVLVPMGLVVALAMGSLTTMEGSATGEDPASNGRYILVLDTPEGAKAHVLNQEQVDSYWGEECRPENPAPIETYCLNLEDAPWGEPYRGHGCLAEIDYSGVVESRIVHDDGHRSFFCDFDAPVPPKVAGCGQWPASGAPYTHEGYSYDGMFGGGCNGLFAPLGEAFGPLHPGDPSGLPGGWGEWGVFVA